jgi:hypothetical protein
MVANPAIQSVTASTSVPGQKLADLLIMLLKIHNRKTMPESWVDNKFIDAYGLKIVAGEVLQTTGLQLIQMFW